jgi:hypothetical protein
LTASDEALARSYAAHPDELVALARVTGDREVAYWAALRELGPRSARRVGLVRWLVGQVGLALTARSIASSRALGERSLELYGQARVDGD